MTDQPKQFDLAAVAARCAKVYWEQGRLKDHDRSCRCSICQISRTDLPDACVLVREMVFLLEQVTDECMEEHTSFWDARAAVLAKVKTEA